jgi:hypothetical protein
MPEFAPKPLLQEGGIMLDPAPDGDVIHGQAALRHDLFQVAVAQRIPQIPPDAKHDNNVSKVSPPERRWSSSAHRITLPDHLEPICNRSVCTVFGTIVSGAALEMAEFVSGLLRQERRKRYLGQHRPAERKRRNRKRYHFWEKPVRRLKSVATAGDPARQLQKLVPRDRG